MENLQLYKKQIKEIQTLIEKLEKGSLKLTELSDLERLTREMHEKSIILRYKAFEKETTIDLSGKEDFPSKRKEEGIAIEPKIEEDTKTSEPEEKASIDFSLFASEGDKEMTPSETEEKPKQQKQEVEQHISVTVTPEEEIIEKKSITTRTEGTTFLDRFSSEDNSVSSKFEGAKISTLVGAFGLNQKLRFINELFNGSSEMFGNAIKILDAQDSFEQASTKVNELAFENSWDVEEEAVIEFMEVLNRRYA